MDARTRSILNLRQGRPDWYTIKNLANGAAEVLIYDEIGFYGVTAQDFIKDLSAVTGPISLRLNSPGGEVFEGLTIYNALKRHGNVAVTIDGIAASIASVIAMAASPGKLAIAKSGSLMIHDGFSMAVGNAADMRKLADVLDEQSDVIAGIYADRTGQPADHWRTLMQAETWFAGQKAVDAGLVDSLADVPAVSASWDLSIFANAPAHLTNAATVPYVSSTDTRHAPMTGTHTHDHAAGEADDHDDGLHSHPHTHSNDADHFGHSHKPSTKTHMGHTRLDPDGDGDCDACPEGDTDHSHWDRDGHQIRPLSASLGAVFLNVTKPYGDVPYADPGYLDADGEQVSKSGKEGVARYPIDAEHVKAAWGYINQEKNASQYTATQLAHIKSAIKAAMKKHGHEVSDASDQFDPSALQALLTTGLEGVRA